MKRHHILTLTLLALTTHARADVANDSILVDDEDGVEEVIALPEAMDNDVDSLLHLYNINTYLRVDTDCVMSGVNPVYSDEDYQDRLSRLPTIIEMPYNDVVRKMIDRYTSELRRKVSVMLGACNFYMPIFEQALDTYQLPMELKYLPVIESALDPNAVSRVGATGLWQFMLATGKHYGLEVNSLVDERRDPIKSSYAAAQYLGDLYRIFGDWNLVIAAYNCGPETVNKAIHRAGGERDYWQIYPYLPKETRGYLPAFIAANYVMNYYCEHNICPMVTKLPEKTDTVMVNTDVHFEQIAHVLGMSTEEIASLNPQYRRAVVNGNSRPSTLRLPQRLVNTFLDNEEDIYAYKSDSLLTKRNTVEVAQAKTSYSSGKKRSYGKKSKKSRSRKGKRTRSKSVTVRSGDTLSEIAARNHTTVSKLRKLNRISGSNIRAGKKIRVK